STPGWLFTFPVIYFTFICPRLYFHLAVYNEDKRVITLHHKDGRWIIFPKRLFSDESEVTFFRACTQKKISPISAQTSSTDPAEE
ncbi:MAG: hypothetical protein JXR40_13220, partial [Pontiellaceae bacterium]|nr:hypothetical protein [Pontiellaceae bacterium]